MTRCVGCWRGDDPVDRARLERPRQMPTPQCAKQGWSATTVAGILRNPRIAGLRTYRGEVVGEGCWPAIVDRETFERLQAKIRPAVGSGPFTEAAVDLDRVGAVGAELRCGRRIEMTERPPRCPLRVHETSRRFRLRSHDRRRRPARPTRHRSRPASAQQQDGRSRALRKPKRQPVDVDLTASNATRRRRSRLRCRSHLEAGMACRTAARRTPRSSATRRRPGQRDRDPRPISGADVRDAWDQLSVERRRAVLHALIDRVVIRPATTPGRFTSDRVDVEWRV